ncbi:unnamed protein product [Euphydryas editha]|uniref:Uncharacterized protein n=1 Tax=Euphydryas editha TaxID=104508 RepID=A0AAU9VAK1_EUPED|nr:unnamed protein product [Euphydryas editha]
MGHKTEDSTAFTDAVRSATTSVGKVKTLMPTTTIEILDLDRISTEDDVRETLKCDFTTSLEIKSIQCNENHPARSKGSFLRD